MESQLSVDPDPEPPSYKIHKETRGRYTVWVVTQNKKFITVLSQRNLAHNWVSRFQNLHTEVSTSYI